MYAEVKKRETLHSGQWLSLEDIRYTNSDGIERSWESVSRLHAGGAVLIVAETIPSEKLILVRQFRPPADGFVIEFPAGLVDDGEKPSETAVRELQEETGYTCSVREVMPPAFSSPGLSSETVRFVFAEVDEYAQVNSTLQTEFDESEEIETLLVARDEIYDFLIEQRNAGDFIDSKLLAYAVGLNCCR